MSGNLIVEYPDGTEIDTIMLGKGDVIISTIHQNEDGLHGIGFSPTEAGYIGRDFPELYAKFITELNPYMQILSSKKESLIVLRDAIDKCLLEIGNSDE